MDLPPFLLNDWLESRSNVRFNLAGSTGPGWTLDEVLRLGDHRLDLGAMMLSYAPPEGTRELREEIAAHHEVDPECVIVTNGASEAFLLLLSALARPAGNVVLPMPAYPAFAGVAHATHLVPLPYALSPEHGFRMEPDAIAALADEHTVLAVVNSPQNPTGALMPHEDCDALSAALHKKGVPLLIDEVFHPIYHSAQNRTAAGIDNVVVIGDMSKALSLPGLRMGWIIDRDPTRRASMIRTRSYLSLSGSPILEAIASHAMRNRGQIIDCANAVALDNLQEMDRFMERVCDTLAWVRPQAGTLAFPWFRDGRDSRPFCERLRDRDVFVAPGDCFGMPAHMRMGFGSQREGIGEALHIIEEELHRAAGGATT